MHPADAAPGGDATMRFLVVADPQFKVAEPGRPESGYRWTGDGMWPKLPEVAKKVGTRHVMVCGDLFEYAVGDGSTLPALWDEWDRYARLFDGAARLSWIVGGHEFWPARSGEDPRGLFLKRYPERVRYQVRAGDDLFLMFDNIHDPRYLDAGGLAWLEQALKDSAGAKRVWFLGHVPPRNTAEWWPDALPRKNDAFRIRMAELLEQHHVAGAFFGHEHMECFLGDPGGFPMFAAGCRYPLLVEAGPEGVSYRWLLKPLDADPLASAVDALRACPVAKWHVAVLRPGEPLPDDIAALDPANPPKDSADRPLRFQEVAADAGRVDLVALPGLADDDRVLAVATYPLGAGYHTRHALLRSDIPFSIWINGALWEQGAPTGGRFHAYMAPKETVNRAVLLLEVKGKARTFSFFRQCFPPDLAAEESLGL